MKVGIPTRRGHRVIEREQTHHDNEHPNYPPIEAIPSRERDTRSTVKTEVEGKGIGECREEIGIFHIEGNHGERRNKLKEESDFGTLNERENQREEGEENSFFMHYKSANGVTTTLIGEEEEGDGTGEKCVAEALHRRANRQHPERRRNGRQSGEKTGRFQLVSREAQIPLDERVGGAPERGHFILKETAVPGEHAFHDRNEAVDAGGVWGVEETEGEEEKSKGEKDR